MNSKSCLPNCVRRKNIWTITPCHGRSKLAIELLDSLIIAKSIASNSAQIQICLIDSTPVSNVDAQEIMIYCRDHDAIYLRGPESVREKRNKAANYATEQGAEILFFTDSDCRVCPDVFLQHLKGYGLPASPFSQRPIGAVTGITRFEGKTNAVNRAVALTPFLDAFTFAEKMPETPFAPCTNFSVLTSTFRQVGGFPEAWHYRLGGDDTELGRQINNAGFAIISQPGAIVFHTTLTWSRWSEVTERVWRWGRMDIMVRRAEARQNIHSISPMPWQTALLIAPIALLFGYWPFFCLLALTLLGAPALASIMRFKKNISWSDIFRAELLIALFHIGSIVESLLCLKPWWSFREVVTHPMQIGTSWTQRRQYAWVTIWMIISWITLTNGMARFLTR